VIIGAPAVGLADGAPPVAELLACALEEDVVALVSWRLQQASRGDEDVRLDRFFSALTDAFSAAARGATVRSMLLDAESRRVLAIMDDAKIPGLLLKGSALAHWAYSQPQLRACADVDLLVASRDAAEQLSARLVANGYRRARTSGELVAHELLCTREVTPEWEVEIDVHWRVINSPLFAHAFNFDELMAESIALPTLAINARGLGPVHALLHACVHRAQNLSIGISDTLKWLYDVIVLMDQLTPVQSQRLVQLAADRKLAGVVQSALHAAASMFAYQVRPDVVAGLRLAAADEPLDARRLSDWRYMQWRNFRALPSAPLRARWLWQRVFPSRDYMTALYGEQSSYAGLMMERLRRLRRRLSS